ncbi:hypothetical protein BJV74DRAFT_953382 [Russula compacta]|nr:hypothetical protein BJV74DRAFT_953382 [Russula compacta]
MRPKARLVVLPRSPRRTRALLRSGSVNPLKVAPAAAPSRTITRAWAKAKAAAEAATATTLVPVRESQVIDEFVAHSDDEHDMHTRSRLPCKSRPSPGAPVLLTLRRRLTAPEGPPADNETHSPSAADDAAAFADPDDDDDESDAELLAYVRKLDVGARAPPPASQNSGNGDGGDNEPDYSSSEEIFPSPGMRAGAEKRRRTQAAKGRALCPAERHAGCIHNRKERAREALVGRR